VSDDMIFTREEHRGWSIRIYPNKKQKQEIDHTIEACRQFWNCLVGAGKQYRWILADLYQDNGEPTKEEKKQIRTDMYIDSCGKRSVERFCKRYPEFADVCKSALYQEKRKYDNAIKQAQKGLRKWPHPHKDQSFGSYRLQGNGFRWEEKRIHIGKIADYIKMRDKSIDSWSAEVLSQNNDVTVKRSATGKYYIVVARTVQTPIPRGGEYKQIIGLDMSFMANGFVTSEGETYSFPRHFRKTLERRRHLNRRMSKKQKGSKNFHDYRKKIARIDERIRNQLKDFQLNIAKNLTQSADAIIVEKLSLSAMQQIFGKSIREISWGQFTEILKRKCKENNCELIEADRFFPSTQLCNKCGYQNRELAGKKGLSIRSWVCPECGKTLDRDINAALNLAQYGRETIEMVARTISSQEPVAQKCTAETGVDGEHPGTRARLAECETA